MYVEVSYKGDKGIGFGDNIEHIDEFPQVKGEIMNLMVQRTLCSTKLEEFSQQNKIFETNCLFEYNVCLLNTDGGSCKTLVSKDLVKALKLPTEQHPTPHKLGWIKKGPEVKVSEVCKITIAIGNSYYDVVSCDVVDLRASHVLLGRPQHDMNAIYRGMMNFHVLNWCGKNMASLLNSTRPPDLKTN